MNRYQSNVKKLIQDLPDELFKLNQELGLVAKQMITERFTEEGKTAEGKSLGKYSTRPMSPLFFLGQGIKSADAKIKKKLQEQKRAGQRPGISYEDWRRMNNLPVEHVTLSFTTETLKDIDVINNRVEGGIVTTHVGSKSSKSKDVVNKKGKVTGQISTGQVLDDLNDRYGRALDTELLSLSKDEEQDLMDLVDARLQQLLDKHFA